MAPDILPADYYQSARPVIGDWGKTVSFTPRIYIAPTSIAELTQFLTDMLPRLPEGASLRVLGGLHSCSEIFVSDVVIDTSRLPLEFEATPLPGGGGTVVASAWMHVHDFLYRAAAHDLSLTATGGTDAQTLAGLIATNTAGATVHHSVYETVDWVEYLAVASDGKSIVQKRVSSTEPDFRAVICSLGVIGFVLRIGFTLVKQVYCQCEYQIKPLSEVLDDTVKTNGLYDFWRIEWIPDTDFGQLWTAMPIDGSGDPNMPYPDDKDQNELKTLIHFTETTMGKGPFLSWPLALAYQQMRAAYTNIIAKGPMRLMIPCDRLAQVHVAMAEWSFDPADLQRVLAAFTAYFKSTHWPALPIEIQSTRVDNYLMSAWNWPGLDYIVKFNIQYLTDYMDAKDHEAMMINLHGLWNYLDDAGIRFKAHWGKLNFLTADRVARDNDLKAFLPHVQPLFLNESMRARLIEPSPR